MSKIRTPLILSTALAAAFAASGAFAQDAGAQQQQTPPPQDTTQTPPAAQAGEPAKKSWGELDADGNGSLSLAEAGALDSLAKVFTQADADANGELTQDEYKAWLAANGSGSKDVPKK